MSTDGRVASTGRGDGRWEMDSEDGWKDVDEPEDVRGFSRLFSCEDIQSCGPELREVKKSIIAGVRLAGGRRSNFVPQPLIGSCRGPQSD